MKSTPLAADYHPVEVLWEDDDLIAGGCSGGVWGWPAELRWEALHWWQCLNLWEALFVAAVPQLWGGGIAEAGSAVCNAACSALVCRSALTCCWTVC